jgi:hypothetical protein
VRAEALGAIAKEMAKARAKDVFDQALKVAEGIEDAWSAGRGIECDCERDGEGRDGRTREVFDQALKVAEGIEEEW